MNLKEHDTIFKPLLSSVEYLDLHTQMPFLKDVVRRNNLA